VGQRHEHEADRQQRQDLYRRVVPAAPNFDNSNNQQQKKKKPFGHSNKTPKKKPPFGYNTAPEVAYQREMNNK